MRENSHRRLVEGSGHRTCSRSINVSDNERPGPFMAVQHSVAAGCWTPLGVESVSVDPFLKSVWKF